MVKKEVGCHEDTCMLHWRCCVMLREHAVCCSNFFSWGGVKCQKIWLATEDVFMNDPSLP